MNSSPALPASGNVHAQLMALLSPRAQAELAVVRDAIAADPKLLDNHSRELRTPA